MEKKRLIRMAVVHVTLVKVESATYNKHLNWGGGEAPGNGVFSVGFWMDLESP